MPIDGSALPRLALVALHVLSVLLWIGSLVSMTRVLAAADGEPDLARSRLAGAARKIYRAVASPWMGVAVLTGIALWFTAPSTWQARDAGVSGSVWLLRQGYFHTKLTGVLVLLALHFVLGARIRRAEREGGAGTHSPAMRMIQLGVLFSAALIVAVMYPWRRTSAPACRPAVSRSDRG